MLTLCVFTPGDPAIPIHPLSRIPLHALSRLAPNALLPISMAKDRWELR